MKENEEFSDFRDAVAEVVRLSGIPPGDSESLKDYMEAVIRAEDTTWLKAFAKFTSSTRLQEIIKDELKTRGEINND